MSAVILAVPIAKPVTTDNIAPRGPQSDNAWFTALAAAVKAELGNRADGSASATASTLAAALVREGMKSSSTGANSMALK